MTKQKKSKTLFQISIYNFIFYVKVKNIIKVQQMAKKPINMNI